jgi:predicted dehydrogenase
MVMKSGLEVLKFANYKIPENNMNETRRDFLKQSALAAAAIAVGSFSTSAKSYSRIMGANDRINFAIIGLHGRAYAHLEGVSMSDNTMITYICDVDKHELEKFGKAVKDKIGTEAKPVGDFRKLLESNDVDAITIATPEHWQAHIAIDCLKAGKNVYVEKPSSHNPYEGQLLVKAQKKYGKLVQLGNQQRSAQFTIDIIKKIHEGLIGKPYFGKAWYANTRKSIGVGKVVSVPDYLDWELWQGPAPRRPFKDNIHPYNWHWFWHYGTGETLNNGTHEVDICRWALQADLPNRISASGGRYHFKDDWEFYDTLVTNYEYDDKMITWEGKSCQGKKIFNRDRGVAIHGTEGTVVLDRGGYEVHALDDSIIDQYKVKSEASTQDLRSIDSMTVNHFKNFVNAMRKGEKQNSPIAECNKSVEMLQLSNIAWKVGRVLNIDKENGAILNDKEAMKLWRRQYEKGWELKV